MERNVCADPGALETLHLVLSSSGRLMRILGSIVAPSTAFMAFCDPEMTGCSSIRSQLICDELVWDKAIFLQKLAREFKRGAFVPSALDRHIEDFALGIHGAPKIDHAAGDFQIDLVKIPGSVWLGSRLHSPPQSWARNDSPSAEQSRRRP